MKAAKRWGSTEVIVDTPFCEVHRIEVNPYQKCSRHKHEFKNNAFYVEAGLLRIWMEDGEEWAYTDLGVGESLNAPPGIEHQFETTDIPVIAYEIYWPDGCIPDIVRRPE